MSTRVEKRKRLKKQKRRNFCKCMIFIFTLLILYFGIKVVNQNLIYLDHMENPTIFSLDIKEKKLDLFGKRYFVDLKILKKDN